MSHLHVYEWVPVPGRHYDGALVLALVCRGCQ